MSDRLPEALHQRARSRSGPVVLGLGLLSLVWALVRVALLWTLHQGFPGSTLLTDRDGVLLRLTTARDGQYRLWTPLEEFSQDTVSAVLLKEDQTFWWNFGVDVQALGRAAWHGLVVRDYRSGASTITMQAVRLAARLDTSRPVGKVVQLASALAATVVFSKAEILEIYLNLAPCGANVQGLGTASRIWFGKAPGRLNLSESLALAVLPQDPAHRNPGDPLAEPAVEAARNRLAKAWLSLHSDPQGTLASQLAMPLGFRKSLPFLAPHVTTALLAENPGQSRIRTTLSVGLQRLVEGAIHRFTRRNAANGITNAAALLVRAETMEVLASVGSADFNDPTIQGQVDGTRALRSPGSTLKPFLYALALQQGKIHPLTTLKDARIHFGGYNPDNFDNEFEGPIRAVDALVKSRNVPAVILTNQVKNPDLYEFLQQAGLGLPFSREHYGLSIILGGAEVTMTDLVRLYGSLAGQGDQAGITRPLKYRADGPPTPPSRLLTAEAAWLVRKMMATKPRPDADAGWNTSPVLADSAAELGKSNPTNPRWTPDPKAVAYKTGTSVGFRDAWSVGIADGMVLAVWVGDFTGTSNPEYNGLQTAAPLMFDIIDAWRAAKTIPEDLLPDPGADHPPAGIVFVPVCAVSGGIATSACPQVIDVPFIAGVSPIAACTVHQVFQIDQRTGMRRNRAIQGVTKPVTYEVWPSDLMDLFAQAGAARTVPPPMDPSDTEGSYGAWPPQIQSPVKGLVYHRSRGEERIPLVAAVGSDTRSVWWFIDDAVVGHIARGETLLWEPKVGHHVVRAVDEAGRSDETTLDVEP